MYLNVHVSSSPPPPKPWTYIRNQNFTKEKRKYKCNVDSQGEWCSPLWCKIAYVLLHSVSLYNTTPAKFFLVHTTTRCRSSSSSSSNAQVFSQVPIFCDDGTDDLSTLKP
jgi:hypothetical protein